MTVSPKGSSHWMNIVSDRPGGTVVIVWILIERGGAEVVEVLAAPPLGA